MTARFWAHDIAGMDRMDREMDAVAVARSTRSSGSKSR